MSRKTFFFLLISLVIIFLVGCNPSAPAEPTSTLTLTSSPTTTHPPTSTPTFTPSPTPTPTPTPKLPVSFGDNLPPVVEPISINNADQLRMLANFERFNPAKIMVKVSPDGEYFFVVTKAGIDIYNAKTRALYKHHDIFIRLEFDNQDLSAGYNLNDLQISSDSSRFMARVNDNTIVVYNLDGEEIFTYNTPSDLSVSTSGAGFSPDGKYLVVDNCSGCSSYKGWTGYKMADIDAGEVRVIWAIGRDPSFSPDGTILVTRAGNKVRLWDTSNWKLLTSYPGTQLIFSKDMTYGASLSALQTRWTYKPGKVIIWQMEDRKQMQEIIFHCGDESPQAIFSPNNVYIAILACNKVKVWKISSGSVVFERPDEYANISSMSLNDSGKLSDYQVKPEQGKIFAKWSSGRTSELSFVEDQASLKLKFAISNNLCTISFGGSHNCVEGEFILGSDGEFYQTIFDRNNNTFEILPGKDGSGTPILSFNYGGLAVNPVGLDIRHQLLFYNRVADINVGTPYVMDMATGKNILDWPDKYMTSVSFSPDGKFAAFMVVERVVDQFILMDLEKRQIIIKMNRSYSSSRMEFSPDGKSLVHRLKMGQNDERSNFYYIMDLDNPPTSTRYQIAEIPDDYLQRIHFSPDGSLLVLAYRSGTIRLLNAQDGSLVFEWKAHELGYITSITFTQDMNYLATAFSSGNIRIWGISDISDEGDATFGSYSPPYSTPVVPTPSLVVDDSNQRIIYDEGLRSGWADWSWDSSVNLYSLENAQAGSKAIKVSLEPWGALSLHHNGLGLYHYH